MQPEDELAETQVDAFCLMQQISVPLLQYVEMGGLYCVKQSVPGSAGPESGIGVTSKMGVASAMVMTSFTDESPIGMSPSLPVLASGPVLVSLPESLPLVPGFP